MNGTLTLAAASIVGLGIYSAVPGTPVAMHHFGDRAADQTMAEIRVDLSAQDLAFADCIEQIGVQSDHQVFVYWQEIEDYGGSPEELISIEMADLPLDRALTLIGAITAVELAFTFDGELLEIGPTEFILARTMEFVSYDVTAALDLMQDDYAMDYEEAGSRITDVLDKFVAPEHWESNGGGLARKQLVGGRLFVEAPRVMQEKTAWVLGELISDPGSDLDSE